MAAFPPTLQKSSFGFGLSDKQLEERRAALEVWTQSVLRNYFRYPEAVRNTMDAFLLLADDDPLRPEAQIYMAILSRASSTLIYPSLQQEEAEAIRSAHEAAYVKQQASIAVAATGTSSSSSTSSFLGGVFGVSGSSADFEAVAGGVGGEGQRPPGGCCVIA